MVPHLQKMQSVNVFGASDVASVTRSRPKDSLCSWCSTRNQELCAQSSALFPHAFLYQLALDGLTQAMLETPSAEYDKRIVDVIVLKW